MTSADAPRCLVFMPMLAGYERIRASVARAIAAGGAAMWRLEQELPDSDWHQWLIDALGTAGFVVADLTDHNPFVMYELGLAHSRQLPAMLIVDARNPRISPTVRGSAFLPYDTADLAAFEERLSRWVASAVGGLQCALSDCQESYGRALRLLEEFRVDCAVPAESVGEGEFTTRLLVTQGRGDRLCDDSDSSFAAWYLLSHVVRDSDRTEMMTAIEEWSRSTRLTTSS